MESAALTATGTIIGAVVALVAALAVQIRTAAATRAQSTANLQREALATLVTAAELLADDVREMRHAHNNGDHSRRDAVWPRYLEHWSDFVGAITRVRLHGPEELRDQAWTLHQSRTAHLSDLTDRFMRGQRVSQTEWDQTTTEAEAAREQFARRAIEVMDARQR